MIRPNTNSHQTDQNRPIQQRKQNRLVHDDGDTNGSFECFDTEAYTIATQTLEHTTAQPDRAHLFRLAASDGPVFG